MKRIRYTYILLTLVLSASGILLWAYSTKGARLVNATSRVKKEKRIYTENELLERFQKISTYMSPSAQELTIQGSIRFKELGNQTAFDEDPAPYCYSKKGNEFYYRMGDLEYYNSRKVAIQIDHVAREIRKDRSVNISNSYLPGIQVDKLPELIRLEGYKLSSTEQGNLQTIYLKNESHFTCKEYALTFDTLSMVPKHIFARFTGTSGIDQTEGERHIFIDINKATHVAQLESLFLKIPLQQKGGKWVALPEYNNYALLDIK
jgi:hypothetical protein